MISCNYLTTNELRKSSPEHITTLLTVSSVMGLALCHLICLSIQAEIKVRPLIAAGNLLLEGTYIESLLWYE